MKRVCLLSMLLPLWITSCINFNPKQRVETTEEEEAVIENDPLDSVEMAQNTHLKFKGIPIDGNIDKFVARMRRSNFQLEEVGEGMAVLSGDFASFKKCVVYVSTLDQHDLVYRISVIFPDRDQWAHLYGDYKHLKELLIEKYGKPASCVEKFQGSYMPTDDGDRMYDVKFDRCKYETRFAVKNGKVTLCIQHDERLSCFVTLTYIDNENGNTIKKYALEDL